MFKTDKFIYLHMRKTAGSQIIRILNKVTKGVDTQTHNSIRKKNHPQGIIGSIRNPWDWYVSLWAYGCERKERRFLSVYYGNLSKREGILYFLGREKRMFRKKGVNIHTIGLFLKKCFLLTFLYGRSINSWRSAYDAEKSVEAFRKWLKFLLKERKNEFLDEYPYYPLSKFAGFMTHQYCETYLDYFNSEKVGSTIKTLEQLKKYDANHNLLDYVIKTESLEEDLIDVLRSLGHTIDKKTEDMIHSLPKINGTSRKDYTKYYDDECRQLVLDNEKFLIEKYGYTFD